MRQDTFTDSLIKNKMIQAGDKVIVGVSGGADSVCLLSLLAGAQEAIGFQICAVHVHHGIRGEEADRDAAFVMQLCRRLAIPFRVRYCDVPAYAREQKLSTEEAARILRYDLLCEEMELQGAGALAIAHNKNDQAETVLFHLFRGSGVKGLSGIAAAGPIPGHEELGERSLIRPLLDYSREEIEAYLEAEQLSFCLDGTNADEAYARNRIRRTILPQAEKINQGAVEHLAQTAKLMGELDEWIMQQTKEAAKAHVRALSDHESLLLHMEELPGILARTLVRDEMNRIGKSLKDISVQHVEAVLGLMEKQTGRSIDLPAGLKACRTYEGILLEKKQTKSPKVQEEILLEALMTGQTRTVEFQGMRITIELHPNGTFEKFDSDGCTKWFDYDKIKGGLSLRNRRAGDWFQPFPDGGTKTLKRWMTDEKLPSKERERLPLLAAGDHIVWMIGKRTSEAFRITGETKRVLKVTAEYLR